MLTLRRRCLIAVTLLLPAPVLADVVQPPASATSACGRDNRVLPAASIDHGGFQRLDRLPPASAYLAVYRSVGGCPAPVIVRYDIGASAPRR